MKQKEEEVIHWIWKQEEARRLAEEQRRLRELGVLQMSVSDLKVELARWAAGAYSRWKRHRCVVLQGEGQGPSVRQYCVFPLLCLAR